MHLCSRISPCESISWKIDEVSTLSEALFYTFHLWSSQSKTGNSTVNRIHILLLWSRTNIKSTCHDVTGLLLFIRAYIRCINSHVKEISVFHPWQSAVGISSAFNPSAAGLQPTLGLLPVSANTAHLAKGLSAAWTAVGLLLCVDCAVPLQVAGWDETLPT